MRHDLKRMWPFGLWMAFMALGFTEVQGQSSISTTQRHTFCANAGWIDWKPNPTFGVKLYRSFLSGYAYAANLGWIHFGDGSPNNGFAYSNASAVDYGVNLTSSGEMTGYAYAPNCGWIQFGAALGATEINFLTGKITGTAYSPTVGWMDLETPFSTLASAMLVQDDLDGDGLDDSYELKYFGKTAATDGTGDADGDGLNELEEFRGSTNPLSPTSKLQILNSAIEPTVDGNIELEMTLSTVPGRIYQIESTSHLGGAWLPITESPLRASTTTTTVSFKLSAPSQRHFYRARAILPL